ADPINPLAPVTNTFLAIDSHPSRGIYLTPTCRIFDFIRLPKYDFSMTNKRQALRFEKVFPVILSTEAFGECNAMARNISAGGILVELSEPMPLGTEVRVHFWMPDSQA